MERIESIAHFCEIVLQYLRCRGTRLGHYIHLRNIQTVGGCRKARYRVETLQTIAAGYLMRV